MSRNEESFWGSAYYCIFVVSFLSFQNIVLLEIVVCNYANMYKMKRLYVFDVFFILMLVMAENE